MRRRRPTKRKVVGDLELIAKATEPAFWPNPIEQLPGTATVTMSGQ